MGALINRTADNWRPLFAIADLIGDDWPVRIREAAAVLAPRDSESTGPMLLADIKEVFDEKGTDRLASADMCEALTAMEGRPWAEWKASKGASPKPLTPNQLARLLKAFGVKPDNVRTGKRVPKGYYRHQFEEPWQRYLAAQDVNEPLHRYNVDKMGTSSTFQSATSDADVAVQKCEKSNIGGRCSGVADQSRDRAEGLRCDHCDAPDAEGEPLLEVYDGERDVHHLHRRCIDARQRSLEVGAAESQGDGLQIPDFLDRRHEAGGTA
jgi:hypothetical protein